jgi:hypothetical protein
VWPFLIKKKKNKAQTIQITGFECGYSHHLSMVKTQCCTSISLLITKKLNIISICNTPGKSGAVGSSILVGASLHHATHSASANTSSKEKYKHGKQER